MKALAIKISVKDPVGTYYVFGATHIIQLANVNYECWPPCLETALTLEEAEMLADVFTGVVKEVKEQNKLRYQNDLSHD